MKKALVYLLRGSVISVDRPPRDRYGPNATAAMLHRHAPAIREVARLRNVSDLRVAATGELVGRVAADADMFEVVEFELAVSEVIGGAEVYLISDVVLDRDGIDPRLRKGMPL